MTYHDLSTCTLNSTERREEADRILEILEVQAGGEPWQYTDSEQRFITKISDLREPVSVKQLFWLRDIKDKYL